MKIIKNISVPTGNILIGQGEKGLLEFLSIGDYGKEQNIKADFLGLTKEIDGVPHGKLMPLEDKWVVTISSQYGCSMGCQFCDVPKVGPGVNATLTDLINQVKQALQLHPEVKSTKRLNLHFARMGEPSFNSNVIEATEFLQYTLSAVDFKMHPVVSTMMPKANKKLQKFINTWLKIKNETMEGEAGLQLSINTTNEETRTKDFNGSARTLEDISKIMKKAINKQGVKGRKIALNFAVDDNTEIDAQKLYKLFSPEFFMCKLTPMHVTQATLDNDYKTTEGYSAYYPYKRHEETLKDQGFDVIVFVPSKEEDESRITCGNAILADEELK